MTAVTSGNIPVGITDFEKLRNMNAVYIDKTSFLNSLLTSSIEVFLLLRPRRFGKTLSMSMLSTFLEMNYENPEDRSRQENLFRNLKVYKENRKLCDEYMGRYPVISLSLKDTEGANFEEAAYRVIAIFAELARKFNFLRKNKELDTLFLKRIQDFNNKILCVNSGATTNATGQGTCKECKATFPNDAAQCPNCGAPYKKNSLRRIIAYVIPALLLIAGFMFGVYLSFLENNYNKSDTTYVTEESYEKGVSELKKGSDGQLGMYYPDGDLNSAYYGFVEKDGDWYFVENGYVNTDYVGINQNGDEIWY